MSRRVVLGKLDGTNYGLVISKLGFDAIDTSGNIANTDLLIFDSREKGYAQVIARGSTTVTRTGSNAGTSTVTFSSIPIPNPVVIAYAGGELFEITSTSETAVQFTVPAQYGSYDSIFGFSYFQNFGAPQATPLSTTINYVILRGFV